MCKETLKALLKQKFGCPVSEVYNAKDRQLNIYIQLDNLGNNIDVNVEGKKLESFFRTPSMIAQINSTLKEPGIQKLVIGVTKKITPEINPITWSPRQGRDYKEYFFESS